MRAVEREIPRIKAQSYFCEMADWLHKDFGTEFKRTLDRGRFYAIVPEEIEPECLVKLDAGGIVPEGKEFQVKGLRVFEKNTLEIDFTRKLAQVLKGQGHASIVGFDGLIKKEDFPDRSQMDLSKPPFGVFHGTSQNSDEVREFINNYSSAWKTVVLVVDKPLHVETANGLADSLILFAVSAYDGESFAYWQRLTDG